MACKIRHMLINKLITPLHARCFANQAALKRTCLYDFHKDEGAKLVPFAGWEMPVQYKTGISDEHLHVRKGCGIFDVSHMLQTRVDGADMIKYIESMVVTDIQALKGNQGTLTVFTDSTGGILDDLIVNKTREGHLYVVSNAGCADQDLANMRENESAFQKKGADAKLSIIDNALIAVQGPDMVKALQPGLDFDLKDLPFMTNCTSKVFGVEECRVTRCGYTGEDGVEISIPKSGIHKVVTSLLNSPHTSVKMIGLGARDSLRLEAGLCLYGNDIDTSTTPVEANLTWLVSKSRRAKADFPGANVIVEQIKAKPDVRRVGFVSSGIPIRGGSDVYTEDGYEKIGNTTSGCPSPYLKKNVSMGYVSQALAKNGTKVKIEVRSKKVDAVVTKMPFVPSNYYFVK